MLFIAGVSSKQSSLDFHQTIVCPSCERYGHYEVYMEYMYFSFFFIPLFKWNKKYYVKSSCCNSMYTLSKEKGKAIEKGEKLTIEEKDLEIIESGRGIFTMQCTYCKSSITEEYQYCPQCGKPLK